MDMKPTDVWKRNGGPYEVNAANWYGRDRRAARAGLADTVPYLER